MTKNNLKIKVCGLRDNIAEVSELEPDYYGFIFYPKSPRYVGKGFNMPSDLKGDRVGVFVDQPLEEVALLCKKHQLDFAQLHGSEPAGYCTELKEKGIRVIKVFAGNQLPDQEELDAYSDVVDYYLFDTKLVQHGGTGVSFDWSVLKSVSINKPIILSGGLSLNNIDAVKNIGIPIHAIDVNSQFEIKPGLKDIDKLKELKKRVNKF